MGVSIHINGCVYSYEWVWREHKSLRDNCKDCEGRNVCPCGKSIWNCRKCDGASISGVSTSATGSATGSSRARCWECRMQKQPPPPLHSCCCRFLPKMLAWNKICCVYKNMLCLNVTRGYGDHSPLTRLTGEETHGGRCRKGGGCRWLGGGGSRGGRRGSRWAWA